MITAPAQTGTYWQGTVTLIRNAHSVQVLHDGQTAQVPAICQYTNPVVGDRVLLLQLGSRVYATGPLR